MSVNPEAIDDLFNMVIEDHFTFEKSFADLASLFPDNFVAANVLSRAKKKGGSHKVTWRLKVRNVGNPRFNVGLYDTDQNAREDQFEEGSATYTGINTGTHYDVNEDVFTSPDMAVKVDYLKELIESALQRLMIQFSSQMWTYPGSSTDKGLLGFPYWVSRSTATTVEAFGFNGQAVYGDDIVGGVNQSNIEMWKNGTGVFSTLASEDGLDLLNKAMNECNFRTHSSTVGSPNDRSQPTYMLLTTDENFYSLERYTRNQNDNVGTDLGKYRGSVVFRSQPIDYLYEFTKPYLETSIANPAVVSDNPIYGINMNTFKFLTKLGMGFQKTGPRPNGTQRFVRLVDWDQFAQLVCNDRRKSFVLHQAA